MTGITRQKAAKAVAALFGTTAAHSSESLTYDPWEVADPAGKKWRFVYDGSIRGIQGNGEPTSSRLYKVEMNSPVLEYSEMEKLQQVVRALRRAGAVVNSSCGMHVHVDAANHTPQSLKNAKSTKTVCSGGARKCGSPCWRRYAKCPPTSPWSS